MLKALLIECLYFKRKPVEKYESFFAPPFEHGDTRITRGKRPTVSASLRKLRNMKVRWNGNQPSQNKKGTALSHIS